MVKKIVGSLAAAAMLSATAWAVVAYAAAISLGEPPKASHR